MKERPILFSAPMVRAILEGRKTQTRRIAPITDLNIKPQSNDMVTWGVSFSKPVKGALGSYSGGKLSVDQAQRIIASLFNPYGVPGDRLWVRETWQGPLIDEELEEEFRQSPDYFKKSAFCAYRATDTLDAINADGEELGWRPSIHMPRWASRINLEITGVRVERLADISKDDAMAEGIVIQPDGWFGLADSTHYNFSDPTYSYCSLWESINGAGSRLANPWVWVVEFKRVQP